MDAAKAAARRARRAAMKKQARARKRQLAWEARKEEGGLPHEGVSQKAQNTQAAAPSSTEASTSAMADPAMSELGHSNERVQGPIREGQPERMSGSSQVPTRGPGARKARRTAKWRPLVLPTGPAMSSGSETVGGSSRPSQVPHHDTRDPKTPKRQMAVKDTPPERQRKRARGGRNAPAAGDAHVSPLLRDAGGGDLAGGKELAAPSILQLCG